MVRSYYISFMKIFIGVSMINRAGQCVHAFLSPKKSTTISNERDCGVRLFNHLYKCDCCCCWLVVVWELKIEEKKWGRQSETGEGGEASEQRGGENERETSIRCCVAHSTAVVSTAYVARPLVHIRNSIGRRVLCMCVHRYSSIIRQ